MSEIKRYIYRCRKDPEGRGVALLKRESRNGPVVMYEDHERLLAEKDEYWQGYAEECQDTLKEYVDALQAERERVKELERELASSEEDGNAYAEIAGKTTDELEALRQAIREKAREWENEYRIWYMPGACDDDTGEEDEFNAYAGTIKLCAKELHALLEKKQ